jgi:hypothetical protein
MKSGLLSGPSRAPCFLSFTASRARRSRLIAFLATLALGSLPFSAGADTPPSSTEVAAFLGLGITSFDTGGGLAFRLGLNGAHWLTPWFLGANF